MVNKFKRRSKYRTDGVVDNGPWGGYNSRYEMLKANKEALEASTVNSENRDHYNTRGNFRLSTEMDNDYSQNIRAGSNDADPEMIAKYAQTIKEEEAQYGEDKHGMTPEERAAYNKKYKSTAIPKAAKTEWTFNEAYSAARAETVDQFNQSFIMNTPEQVARNQEVTGRKRIAYGPGDPLSNVERLNNKQKGGFLEPPTEYI